MNVMNVATSGYLVSVNESQMNFPECDLFQFLLLIPLANRSQYLLC